MDGQARRELQHYFNEDTLLLFFPCVGVHCLGNRCLFNPFRYEIATGSSTASMYPTALKLPRMETRGGLPSCVIVPQTITPCVRAVWRLTEKLKFRRSTHNRLTLLRPSWAQTQNWDSSENNTQVHSCSQFVRSLHHSNLRARCLAVKGWQRNGRYEWSPNDLIRRPIDAMEMLRSSPFIQSFAVARVVEHLSRRVAARRRRSSCTGVLRGRPDPRIRTCTPSWDHLVHLVTRLKHYDLYDPQFALFKNRLPHTNNATSFKII